MRAADQFHIGIVVDDFDATLDELTQLFGYEWGDEIHFPTNVVFPDGERTVDFRLRYSRDTPHVEIVESRPGTLWVPVVGIHHVGYWSDDMDADAATLEAAGYAMEARGVNPDGTASFAYHRNPVGPRIELVNRALQPLLEQLWGATRKG